MHSCKNAGLAFALKRWHTQLLPRLPGFLDRDTEGRIAQGVIRKERSFNWSVIFHGTVSCFQLSVSNTPVDLQLKPLKIIDYKTCFLWLFLQQSGAGCTNFNSRSAVRNCALTVCKITPIRDCRWTRYMLPCTVKQMPLVQTTINLDRWLVGIPHQF